MSTTQDRIARLEQQLKKAKAEAKAANKARVDKLKTKQASLDKQLEGLNDRITALDARREALYDKLDEILNELNQLTGADDVSSN